MEQRVSVITLGVIDPAWAHMCTSTGFTKRAKAL